MSSLKVIHRRVKVQDGKKFWWVHLTLYPEWGDPPAVSVAAIKPQKPSRKKRRK